jgi:3-methyladenine DNA glycosylase Tag
MMDVNPPPRHRPRDLAGYLEALSRPVFQAGMSWRVIDAKWEGIRDAFARFDPPAVADFGPADIERLLADPGIVRSRAKIEATIDNAQALLELDAEYGGFGRYLGSHGGFAETVADLKRQFRFTPQGDATRIDHELEMTPKGPFRLFAPIMGMIGRKNLRDTANALQIHLEKR